MKIWTHHYTLLPGPDPARAAAGPRGGALIRAEFADETTGFVDLHPWTDFGHAALSAHLESLRAGAPTALAAIALGHARADAGARRAGVSLFCGLPAVRSHALFTGWTSAPRDAFRRCAEAGYTAAKLKVGRDLAREVEALNALAGLPLRWRLDFNAALGSAESVCEFLARVDPAIRPKIEFLEDPCPYDPGEWAQLAERENIPLALDWQVPSDSPPWPGARILVIKPASQDALLLAQAAARAGMGIVVTHSMDHPLGRAAALWTAMRLKQRHGDIVRDGGLLGAGLYRADEFGGQFADSGPETSPPHGIGFGFDEILQALPWRRLC